MKVATTNMKLKVLVLAMNLAEMVTNSTLKIIIVNVVLKLKNNGMILLNKMLVLLVISLKKDQPGTGTRNRIMVIAHALKKRFIIMMKQLKIGYGNVNLALSLN